LEENVAALEVTLSKDDLARIDALGLSEKVSGARYPDLNMANVNR
jgi:aryl-alcohol dehydrogenase-like predicted oxidoreductase